MKSENEMIEIRIVVRVMSHTNRDLTLVFLFIYLFTIIVQCVCERGIERKEGKKNKRR